MSSLPGVLENELQIIKNIFKKYLPSKNRVIAFGSRVTGKYRKNSDLDLMIESETALDKTILGQIKEGLEKSALPYQIDLLDSTRISFEILENIRSQKTAQIYP